MGLFHKVYSEVKRLLAFHLPSAVSLFELFNGSAAAIGMMAHSFKFVDFGAELTRALYRFRFTDYLFQSLQAWPANSPLEARLTSNRCGRERECRRLDSWTIASRPA